MESAEESLNSSSINLVNNLNWSSNFRLGRPCLVGSLRSSDCVMMVERFQCTALSIEAILA